jgi:hypothetical protein
VQRIAAPIPAGLLDEIECIEDHMVISLATSQQVE